MEATDINIQQMPILIGQKGEITIPQVVQDSLNVNEGDMLILVQIGNFILLTPQQPEVPELIDQITTLMEMAKYSNRSGSSSSKAIIKERKLKIPNFRIFSTSLPWLFYFKIGLLK